MWVDIRETTKILKPTLMWADIRETTKILKPTLMWADIRETTKILNMVYGGRSLKKSFILTPLLNRDNKMNYKLYNKGIWLNVKILVNRLHMYALHW